MNIILLILLVLIFVFLLKEFGNYRKNNSLLDRFEYGFENDDEDEDEGDHEYRSNLFKINQLSVTLEKSPLLHKFDLMLKRSNLKVNLIGAILIFVLASVIPAVFAYFYWGSLPSFIASLLLFPILLWFLLNFSSVQAQKRLDSQLPALISNFLTTLNAGGTPVQALQTASKNAPSPIGASMSVIYENIQLGKSPIRAWDEWDNYWGTKATKLVSTGIKIKWETGGQMTAILSHILETLEFNRRMELRVETLTAQAKLSSIVLSGLPVALFFLTKAYRPDLLDVMFTDPLGTKLLWAAVILTVVGFIWLQRLAKLQY